jgi:hypothetical protein
MSSETPTWARSVSKPVTGSTLAMAVLAKQQVQAIRRIGNADGAAARAAERFVVLQDSAGLGVENGNGLWGAHLKDGGGVRACIRVQGDGLGPGRDAEVDLGAGGGDDLATTDDPRGGKG